jgi:glutaredoxin
MSHGCPSRFEQLGQLFYTLRMSKRRAVLYTRAGCHLCEDAHQLLIRYGISPELVDIDQDPVLRDRYDECVPVVWIDDRERFRGCVNEVLLRRLLK